MRKHLSRADAIGIRHYLEGEKERQVIRDANRAIYLAGQSAIVTCRDCGAKVQRRYLKGDGRCRLCSREAARIIWVRTEARRLEHAHGIHS